MLFSRRSEPQNPLRQASWPVLPPSLRHGPLEVDEDKEHAEAQPLAQPHYNHGAVTPWLGLRSRLSQVPMNRWTVLLLLLLARLLISLSGLNTNLVTARTQALSACTKVEDVGSSMASMPHYLSVGVNRMAADGITKAVQGMVEILMMVLTGVQQLILFFIEFEIGTFLCLSTAIAQAVLEVGEFAIKSTTELLNDAIETVAHDLKSAAGKVTKALDDIRKALKWVPGSDQIEELIPDTSGLENDMNQLGGLQIDASKVIGHMADLEKDIDYDNIKNMAEEAIAIPFDMVKELLNESYGTWEFDHSVFPVAAKESLSFCSDDSALEGFFEVLFEIAANAKLIAIAALIALAILACAIMLCWETKRFNKELEKSQALSDREPMDVVYFAGRPATARTGAQLSEKLSKDPKRQLLIRWVVACATTYTALFVLTLAVTGAVSCLCQYGIMRVIQQEVPGLSARVGDFAGGVVTSLEKASTNWANDSNGIILGFQSDINDEMFGYVRNATDAANDTITQFNHLMQDGLDKAFGSVPQLDKFFKDIIKCLIGDKLDTVQEGLTWVNEKARVTFPLFPVDVFSAGANESISGDSNATTFLATPSSTVTDEITGAVNNVVDGLWTSIVQEALISVVLLLIYLAYVFFAVAQAAIQIAMRDRAHEDEGRQQSYTGSNRKSHSPTPGIPEMGGIGAVPEAQTEAVDNRHDDSHADQTSTKADYAEAQSRDRTSSPTPKHGYARQSSEYGWIQSPGR
ncbi:plasma membrane fusion protein prm1 [Diaporthe australafricana]|uniref:Plasma membrane fusion protein PRM1 n=1 Tax=Diaporthe australafricana TaxID=127596 RepID=A0ABR3W7Y8_9PEZI